jgi:8-oxo-dGTP diphosphatase
MITVTAGIIQKKNKILIARRKAGSHLSGYWEFPGGKIKPDETPEACLIREIMEELGLHIHHVAYFAESVYEYPEKTVCLKAYLAECTDDEIILNDHDEVAWISRGQLDDYTFAPADVSLVEKLKETVSE